MVRSADSQVIVSANFGGVASAAPPLQAQVITSFDDSRGLPTISIVGITIPLSLMLVLFVVLLAVYLGYRFLPGTRLAVRTTELYENALSRFRSQEEAPETVQEPVETTDRQGE